MENVVNHLHCLHDLNTNILLKEYPNFKKA